MELRIGLVIRGYCNGYFGRDSYGGKRVEAFGADWVVVREDDGCPNFASFDTPHEMEECIKRWTE